MEGTLSEFGNTLLLSFVFGFLITFETIYLGYSFNALLDSGNKE